MRIVSFKIFHNLIKLFMTVPVSPVRWETRLKEEAITNFGRDLERSSAGHFAPGDIGWGHRPLGHALQTTLHVLLHVLAAQAAHLYTRRVHCRQRKGLSTKVTDGQHPLGVQQSMVTDGQRQSGAQQSAITDGQHPSGGQQSPLTDGQHPSGARKAIA